MDRPSDKGFRFVAKPQDINLKWGTSTYLEAIADGPRKVTYTWYKGTTRLSTSSEYGNFKLIQAQEKDAGVYRVVAKSDGVSLEAECTVKILSKC